MRRMWTRALLLGAMGLTGGSVVGCAQERPPINRVQADALAKSFFVGANLTDISDDPEFYMGNRIIDEPRNTRHGSRSALQRKVHSRMCNNCRTRWRARCVTRHRRNN